MGRVYAGILGPLACATVLARGTLQGASADATLKTACLCLFAFAALGALLGQAARIIVEDSVRARFEHERQLQREGEQGQRTDPA